MKRILLIFLVFATTFIGCKKEANDQPNNIIDSTSSDLSLAEVKDWFGKQSNSNLQTAGLNNSFKLNKLSFDWNKASQVKSKKSAYWLVHLSGQPTFQNFKQGYRKIAFLKDSTGQIHAHIMEIIPDAAYLNQKKRASSSDFTGQVFVYSEQYQLLSGRIYHDGKVAGMIKPKVAATNSTNLKVDMMYVVQDCAWYDSSYIDGEGVFTIYSEQVCSYGIYDDGVYPEMDGGGGGGGSTGDTFGGGGGGGGDASSAPPVAELPDQPKSPVNPKAYMNCFGSLPDIGSKETITVYVQEPQPGLPFNYGTNSVGHTAISLSKTYNGQTITQTVGFYPTDSKLAVGGVSAKVVDNTNLNYTVSITYNVIPFEFNAIANFIANPPANYNLYTYNCTNFVSDACKAGNINLPDPTGNVGMFQTGMTPAALGGSIRDVASVNNANTNGGVVGTSHGPCN